MRLWWIVVPVWGFSLQRFVPERLAPLENAVEATFTVAEVKFENFEDKLRGRVRAKLAPVAKLETPTKFCDQRVDRYLVDYDNSIEGFSHKLSNLHYLVKDAVAQQRTLLLNKIILDEMHNSNRSIPNSVWSKYIDCGNVILCDDGECCKVRVECRDFNPEFTSRPMACEAPSPSLAGTTDYASRNCDMGKKGIVRELVGFPEQIFEQTVHISGSPKVNTLADKLWKRIPKKSWYAHIRRAENFNCTDGRTLHQATVDAALIDAFQEFIPINSTVFIAALGPTRFRKTGLSELYHLIHEDDLHETADGADFPDPKDHFFSFAVSRTLRGYFKMEGRSIAAELAAGKALGPPGNPYDELVADVELCPRKI